MPKYKVTNSAVIVDGVRYKRGEIVETDMDLGVRAEPYIEPKVEEPVEEAPKPKRRRTTKKVVTES